MKVLKRVIKTESRRISAAKLPASEQGINYNTYLLGRRGYFELNLVTDRANMEKGKPLAKTLLNAVSFNAGERYSDYDAKSDKVAEYGLALLRLELG